MFDYKTERRDINKDSFCREKEIKLLLFEQLVYKTMLIITEQHPSISNYLFHTTFNTSNGWHITVGESLEIDYDNKVIFLWYNFKQKNKNDAIIIKHGFENEICMALNEFDTHMNSKYKKNIKGKHIKESLEKTSIEIKSEKIHDEQRIKELTNVLYLCTKNLNHINDDIILLCEWSDELNRRLEDYKNKYNKEYSKKQSRENDLYQDYFDLND